MGALGDSSPVPKVAAGVMILAFLLHLISFGAPHWAKSNMNVVEREEHIGLWKFCSSPKFGSETCSDFIDYIFGDWLKAAQSFMTLGFFALLGAVAATAVSALPNFEGDVRILIAAIVVDAVAFTFVLIGISVWAGRYTEYFVTKERLYGPDAGTLDWAFGVAAASCVMIFIGTALEVVELFSGARDDY